MASVNQLVYRSIASSGFQSDDMVSLMSSCKKNNPALEITGMLVYNDGIFLQMIEGDALSISKLYNKISLDPRHGDLKILWSGRADERTFPHWSMAFKDMSTVCDRVLAEHADIINRIFEIDEYEISKGYKLFKALGATL